MNKEQANAKEEESEANATPKVDLYRLKNLCFQFLDIVHNPVHQTDVWRQLSNHLRQREREREIIYATHVDVKIWTVKEVAGTAWTPLLIVPEN